MNIKDIKIIYFLKKSIMPSILEVIDINNISTNVRATIDSTTTTALGTIIGSCLP